MSAFSFLDTLTVEDLKQRVLDSLEGELDTREGGFANDMCGPQSLEIWKVYQTLRDIEPVVYVNENSGEYLVRECAKYGIEPKAGTPATGALVISGNSGSVVPLGSIFLTASGHQYKTTAQVTLRNGTASALAQSLEVGELYNAPAGEVDRQLVSLPGITGVTNPEPFQGGADPESHASLFARLEARRKTPATSGNAYHYRQWALEVEGVGDAKVFPLAYGPGTVEVLLVGPTSQPVDEEVVRRCWEHIEEERPIGAEVTARSAKALDIDVEARVDIDTARTTLSVVEETFRELLYDYLQEVAFQQYEIPLTRIAWLLGGIEGVLDYHDLTVNGGEENIHLEADEVPVLGEVVLS